MEKKTRYSQQVNSSNRAFFFDVREAENGKDYIVFTESQKTDNDEYKRKSIVLFEEDVAKVSQALMSCLMQFRATDREQMVREARSKYPNAFNRWTKEEDAQLKKYFNNNDSIAEIANALGRNQAAIRARLEKHQLIGNAEVVKAA